MILSGFQAGAWAEVTGVVHGLLQAIHCLWHAGSRILLRMLQPSCRYSQSHHTWSTWVLVHDCPVQWSQGITSNYSSILYLYIVSWVRRTSQRGTFDHEPPVREVMEHLRHSNCTCMYALLLPPIQATWYSIVRISLVTLASHRGPWTHVKNAHACRQSLGRAADSWD